MDTPSNPYTAPTAIFNLSLLACRVMWYDRISGNTRNCRSDYRSSLKNLHTVSSVSHLSLYTHMPCFAEEGVEHTLTTYP